MAVRKPHNTKEWNVVETGPIDNDRIGRVEMRVDALDERIVHAERISDDNQDEIKHLIRRVDVGQNLAKWIGGWIAGTGLLLVISIIAAWISLQREMAGVQAANQGLQDDVREIKTILRPPSPYPTIKP